MEWQTLEEEETEEVSNSPRYKILKNIKPKKIGIEKCFLDIDWQGWTKNKNWLWSIDGQNVPLDREKYWKIKELMDFFQGYLSTNKVLEVIL